MTFGKTFLTLMAGVLISTGSFAKDFPACYSVPVPARLKKFANFPVEAVSVVKSPNGATVTVRYRLPEDITGRGGYLIELTAPAPSENDVFFPVSSAETGTRGMCVRTSNGTMCMLQYADLKLNTEANRAFLKEKYRNDPNLEERLAVYNTFDGDAVGILEVFE